MRFSHFPISLISCSILSLVALPAHAVITTTFIFGGLNIISDADPDTIVVTVDQGQVKINGADPDEGPLTPDQITRMTIKCGDGNDTVDVSALNELQGFPFNFSISIDGEAGDDDITGSPFDDSIDGDSFALGSVGSDTINCAGGGDTVVWDAGGPVDTIDGGAGTDDSFAIRTEVTGTSVAITNEMGIPSMTTGPGGSMIMPLPGFEKITFNGRAGNDTFVMGNVGPAGVTEFSVTMDEGGMDSVNVGAFDGQGICRHDLGAGSCSFIGMQGSIQTYEVYSLGNTPRTWNVTTPDDFLHVDGGPPESYTARAKDCQTVVMKPRSGPDTITVSQLNDAGITQLSLLADDGDDQVTTVVQPFFVQDLRGQNHDIGDTLTIDLMETPYIDTGFAFEFDGAQDIRYSLFETIELLNPGPPGDQWRIVGD